MRVLVTGANGFVGPYTVAALRLIVPDAETIATAHRPCHNAVLGPLAGFDVTDARVVEDALERYEPTHVINLAGIAAPAAANAGSDATWDLHVRGVRTLSNAILRRRPDCLLVNVGSGLAYGATAARSMRPLDETALLDPMDDYGASKAAGDLALGALAQRGLRCVRVRPFNHTGPRQTTDFAVPSFAMQIARIELGKSPPVLHVGNLESYRDFLDARDVAEAYALVVRHGDDIPAGSILNIASGTPRRMSDVLQMLLSKSRVDITVVPDPKRMRPSDLPMFVGDASRARALLKWAPRHRFDETLEAVLDDCRHRAASH
jgi:GDP-4-dehydro-6-deoxy-D-mannose reductase